MTDLLADLAFVALALLGFGAPGVLMILRAGPDRAPRGRAFASPCY